MGSWNKIEWTADIDAAIKRVYERRERGGNKTLARRFGLGASAISERAVQLGLPPLIATTQKLKIDIKWLPAEMALIKAHLGEPVAQLRIRLAKKGYNRSEPSIRSLLYRQRKHGDWPSGQTLLEDRDAYSTPDIAQGLGIPLNRVQRWINGGLLCAKGGSEHHFVIARRELRRFLLTYPAHWDHRFADRWFLLVVLAGDEAVKLAAHAGRKEAP